MEKTNLWSSNYLEMINSWADSTDNAQEEVCTDCIEQSAANETPDETTNKKYVILAYIKPRTQRQMYIYGWDDEKDAWEFSAVPYPTTYKKCKHLVEIANKEISKETTDNTWLRKYPAGINLQIVEFNDPREVN